MYKVVFTDNSSKNINKFIDGYLNSFIELFSDSGLYEEETIKNNYIQSSINFQKNIFTGVKNILEQEKVLGFSKLENGNLEITTIVGNYRLFIEFFEEKENKLRFVENIRFFNK